MPPVTLPFTVGDRPEYPAYIHKTEEERSIARIVNNILNGKMNCVGDFTLLADTVQLVVTDNLVNPFSFIDIVPLDEEAAKMFLYAVPGDRQFTVNATVISAIWSHMSLVADRDYTSGITLPAQIDNYDGGFGQSLASHALTLDQAAGEVTIAFAGDYRIDFNATFLAQSNDPYRWWIARNGSFIPEDSVNRAIQITGQARTVSIAVSFIFPANPGDVIAVYIENENGGTDTVFSAYIEAVHIGTTDPIPEANDTNFRYVVIG